MHDTIEGVKFVFHFTNGEVKAFSDIHPDGPVIRAGVVQWETMDGDRLFSAPAVSVLWWES